MSTSPKDKNKDDKKKPAATPDLRKGVHGALSVGSPVFAEFDPLLSEDAGPTIVAPGSPIVPGQTTHE
jgi:hypothetical protein